MINELIINMDMCIRKEDNSNYRRADCRSSIINRINNSIENSGNYAAFSPEFSNGQFLKTSNTINRIVHNKLTERFIIRT
mgnify:CR=1 FL=1